MVTMRDEQEIRQRIADLEAARDAAPGVNPDLWLTESIKTLRWVLKDDA